MLLAQFTGTGASLACSPRVSYITFPDTELCPSCHTPPARPTLSGMEHFGYSRGEDSLANLKYLKERVESDYISQILPPLHPKLPV